MEVYRFPTAQAHFRCRFSLPSQIVRLRFVCSADLRTNGNKQTQSQNNRMFILGMGYVGEFVAKHLISQGQGWAVSGTCTSIVKKEKLGLDVHLFYANQPELEVINIMNQHTHLLVSIPPFKDIGDPMLQHAELLRRELNSERLQWLCYLSTTSVYGDCDGAWVDENYQPKPPTELAKLRLAAEEGWLSLGQDLGLAAHVFRLGGIYGPGRSAIDTIIKAESLSDVQRARSSKKFTSRIHVADICNALNECIRKPSPGRIYNIVDDDPSPRTEVFSFAHKLINEKWPTLSKKRATGEPATEKGNLRGEKRVSNARMKEELGVRLIHPSYRSGLQSICDQIHDHPPIFKFM
ncbi:hypothetical protein QVD17_36779 [Tagetes erecta]|uniref:NAD-dependent epimerase/dehydratase domain-containing protein n=1 Tax=Tagetes erecta TaxID=13708 RepID=A0AAD8JT20_TARER|nr:hypothetical protein QVD17_36779 [Tagetes erecta]